jgi:hypothetical protein
MSPPRTVTHGVRRSLYVEFWDCGLVRRFTQRRIRRSTANMTAEPESRSSRIRGFDGPGPVWLKILYEESQAFVPSVSGGCNNRLGRPMVDCEGDRSSCLVHASLWILMLRTALPERDGSRLRGAIGQALAR